MLVTKTHVGFYFFWIFKFMIYMKSKMFYFLTFIYYTVQYTGKHFYCYLTVQKFGNTHIFPWNAYKICSLILKIIFLKKILIKYRKVFLKAIRKLFCFSVLFQCYFVINKFNFLCFYLKFLIAYLFWT